MNNKIKAFTLIELLVTIAIIGLLAAISLVSINRARTKSRDAKRLADVQQVITALDVYYDTNNNYPQSDNDGCGGWDTGNKDYPLLNNRLTGIMNNPPRDLFFTGNCTGYRYYRYGAGGYGCPVEKGDYYVLGITDMETSSRPYPGSPGFSCSGRNWQNEFDWVIGKYQK